MGHGYWILVGDGYGIGLHMINGRLLEDDRTGRNWWSCGESETVEAVAERHRLVERFNNCWHVVIN